MNRQELIAEARKVGWGARPLERVVPDLADAVAAADTELEALREKVARVKKAVDDSIEEDGANCDAVELADRIDAALDGGSRSDASDLEKAVFRACAIWHNSKLEQNDLAGRLREILSGGEQDG